MRQPVLYLLFALLIVVGSAAAQTEKTPTRLEKQHPPTAFMKDHLKETEQGILEALKARYEGGELGALQTVRDLQQLFPAYPFTSLLAPLEVILKDEQADPMSRMLSALALDEMHSGAGDAVIKNVADVCQDKAVQTLCKALLVKATAD
jgi:hypothetical protein